MKKPGQIGQFPFYHNLCDISLCFCISELASALNIGHVIERESHCF